MLYLPQCDGKYKHVFAFSVFFGRSFNHYSSQLSAFALYLGVFPFSFTNSWVKCLCASRIIAKFAYLLLMGDLNSMLFVLQITNNQLDMCIFLFAFSPAYGFHYY